MKAFINPKYIASLEYSRGEKELSQEIPFSKILLFLPKHFAKKIKLGDKFQTIIPNKKRIVSLIITEISVITTRPIYLKFNHDDHAKFIKVKGELRQWKKKD